MSPAGCGAGCRQQPAPSAPCPGKERGHRVHLNVGTCLAFLSSSFVWFSWKRVFMGNSKPACYRQMFLVSVPHLAKEMNHYLFSPQPMQEMEIKHQCF